MENIQIVLTSRFRDIEVDVVRAGEIELGVTRKQLGKMLGYAEPVKAIAKIHEQNWERLDQLSIVAETTSDDGKQRNVVVYSFKGILEVCRHSSQPNAHAVMDWVVDTKQELRDLRTENKQPSNAIVEVFSSPRFGQIRTVIYNGEIAFVAKDVAEALGYERFDSNLLNHVPAQWKGTKRIRVRSRNNVEQEREMLVLTEQGLYFFLARSDKPLALPFQMWIAGEVIPSIRKHGAYLTSDTIEKFLTDPDTILQIATNWKNERQLRLTAEAQIEADRPKVEFANQIGDCINGVGIREFGRVLRQNGAGFGQNGFVTRLLDDGFVFRDYSGNLRPYAQHVESGLFWEKSVVIQKRYGAEQKSQTMILPKGQQLFLKMYAPGVVIPTEAVGVIPLENCGGGIVEI